MIIIQKICRSRRKQKKIFRQIIPARELFQRAVQMRCQIRSGRSDHWKEILQKKHRIRTKILIASESLEEDSENTEQDTQDVISVFALADGTYTADGFSFEGGTGKTQITCEGITVKEGKTYATIKFSSEKFTRVVVDSQEYLPTSNEGGSYFEIPVALNTDMVITANDNSYDRTP